MDPTSSAYAALGLSKGVTQTFLSWNTPLAIKKRMDEGRTADLADIMARWQPWIPPQQDQVCICVGWGGWGGWVGGAPDPLEGGLNQAQ